MAECKDGQLEALTLFRCALTVENLELGIRWKLRHCNKIKNICSLSKCCTALCISDTLQMLHCIVHYHCWCSHLSQTFNRVRRSSYVKEWGGEKCALQVEVSDEPTLPPLFLQQLDDGWPESVEEQGLLLLVWRHHIRNNILKMCYRQSRRGVLRQNSRSARQ